MQKTQYDVITKEIQDRHKIVLELGKIFDLCEDWFISGSFANIDVDRPKDIDIYFYSEKSFHRIKSILDMKSDQLSNNKLTTPCTGGTACVYNIGTTIFTETYMVRGINYPIQLIYKVFGYPQEIFDTMDINVCKRAILPDCQHVTDATANDPLSISTSNISLDTFSRYLKYYHRYNRNKLLDKPFKYLFDNFLNNTEPVVSYYTDIPPVNANKVVYDLFTSKKHYISKAVQNNIIDRVCTNYPELLI